ncbi:MAG: EamA family transporter [Ignavibacteriae bacterium]|nr:EamA family transporter [Ignavibacteriota bacterium]
MTKLFENLQSHTRGLIYISFTAFLWSSSGLFIKVLTLDAFQISFYRSAIAGLTILIITFLRNKKPKFETDIISSLCAISYSAILIFFVLATKMTTAANAIFLQFTAPIYLLFLEPIFLKTKFKSRDLITILFCIAGMVLFFFGRLDMGSIYGNLLAILSGISFAFFSLFLKWKKQLHGATNTINNLIVGNFLVSLICLPLVFDKLALTGTEFLILLYMGAIQIGVSYMIFNEGIKYISATESMIIAMLEAIFNPIWVFLGIGEKPSGFAIIGAGIIFAAILVHNIRSSRKAKMLIVE